MSDSPQGLSDEDEQLADSSESAGCLPDLKLPVRPVTPVNYTTGCTFLFFFYKNDKRRTLWIDL